MATADLLSEPQDAGAPPLPAPPVQDGAAALGADDQKTWLSTMPEDIRASPSLSRYSSPESLARAYLNAERHLRSEKVPIPKDDTDTEAWDRYYKAGGRPEEPTQYEFAKPKAEEMPEGVVYDEQMEQWWRQSAHEAGLSKRQASKLYEQYRDRFYSQLDASHRIESEQVTKAKVELQRDWGNEFEARRQLAKAAFAEMPSDLQEFAKNSGLVRMPSFLKYLYQTKASTTGELDARDGARGAVESPSSITDRIAEFRSHHAKALAQVEHPEHSMRVRELTQLHERLYPQEDK